MTAFAPLPADGGGTTSPLAPPAFPTRLLAAPAARSRVMGPDELQGRAEIMFLARESHHAARSELRRQYDKMLRPYMHVPGVAEMRQAQLAPFDAPAAWGGGRLNEAGTTIAVIPRDGCVYVIALGSAAISNYGDDDNLFCDVFAEMLLQYRPRVVASHEPSRLVRDYRYIPPVVLPMMRARVDELRTSRKVYNLNAPGAFKEVYNDLMEVAGERAFLDFRCSEGTIQIFTEGEWAMTSHNVPYGWRLVGRKSARLELDEATVAAVREMLQILPDATVSNRDCVWRMAELGLAPKRSDQLTDYRKVFNPDSVIKRAWLNKLYCYELGVFRYVRRARPEERKILDLEPRYNPEKKVYEFVVEQKIPTPEGGWAADPAIYDEIRAVRTPGRRPRTGNGSRMLLAGVAEWQEGGWDYYLAPKDKRYMRLLRRPTGTEKTFDRLPSGYLRHQWDTSLPEVETLATVSADELRQSIVDAVAVGVVDAVVRRQLRVDPVRGTVADVASGVAAVEASIERLRGEARRFLENTDATTNEAVMQDLLRLAAERHARADELETDLNNRRAAASLPLPEAFEADVSQLVRAVATLRDGGKATTAITKAIKQVLPNLRVSVDGPLVRWKCDVALSHTTIGRLLLGPFEGEVINRGRKTSMPRDQRDRCLAVMVVSGEPWERVALASGMKAPWLAVVRGLRQLGVVSDFAASLIPRLPTQARSAIGVGLAVVGDRGTHTPGYATWMAHVYTQRSLRVRHGQWGADAMHAQLLIDTVQAEGGSTTQDVLIRAFVDAGLTRKDLIRAIGGRDSAWRRTVHRPEAWLPKREQFNRAELHRCPHDGCDGHLTKAVRVAEVVDGLLCGECRRMPSHGDVFFPAWYLELGPMPRLLSRAELEAR